MSDKRVLLLAFDPREGEALSAGHELAQKLQGARIQGHRVVAERLPGAFEAARALLQNLLARHRPALALLLGEEPSQARLAVVRLALNLIDARAPDSSGAHPPEQPVVAGAALALASSLPVKAISQTWRVAGVPGEIALTAGTSVLNCCFYQLLHWSAQNGGVTVGGCLMLPCLPEQAARHREGPSMAVPVLLTGLEMALQTALG